MRNESKYKFFLLSILLILAGISFTRTVLEILKSSKRLDATKEEITALEQRKDNLEETIEYKKTDDFIEKTAREELNLVKPGEEVYVVNGSKSNVSSEIQENKQISSVHPANVQALSVKKRIFNLKRWWELFFQ